MSDFSPPVLIVLIVAGLLWVWLVGFISGAMWATQRRLQRTRDGGVEFDHCDAE